MSLGALGCNSRKVFYGNFDKFSISRHNFLHNFVLFVRLIFLFGWEFVGIFPKKLSSKIYYNNLWDLSRKALTFGHIIQSKKSMH